MYITKEELSNILKLAGIEVRGVFHVGAHECEELVLYNEMGIESHDVVWVDAIPTKVKESSDKGVPNVFHGVITDKDDAEVVFHVANNGQSSSVLEFGTHSKEHPHVKYIGTIKQKTITVDALYVKS